jgi:hypothetical protein
MAGAVDISETQMQYPQGIAPYESQPHQAVTIFQCGAIPIGWRPTTVSATARAGDGVAS